MPAVPPQWPVLPLLLGLAILPATARAQTIFEAAAGGDADRVGTLLANDPGLCRARDGEARTPLHYAAYGGAVPVGARLLACGAGIDAQDHDGQSPLHVAAMRGHAEFTRLLLDRGADPEVREAYGRTPLLLVARERGDVRMATILLDGGAEVDTRDRSGATSLNLAAWRGFGGLVDLLLDRGATVPASGTESRALTEFATERGLTRLFGILVERGADLGIRNENGGTLLHSAARGGTVGIVEPLLERGMAVNARDRYGRTPLHYAAERGRTAVIELLVARGADPDARSVAGFTPVHAAATYGRAETVAQLVRLGAVEAPPGFPTLAGDYYGQAPPGAEPALFALDIVSSHRFEHGTVVFSPDGSEAMWASSYEPSDSGYSYGRLLTARRVHGRWTPPAYVPFTDLAAGGDVPQYSADGRRLYFASMRPHPVDGSRAERIWYVDRAGDGWSEPVVIDGGPNALTHHWQFSVAANGNIYFSSTAPGGLGRGDLYVSRYVNGRWVAPEHLPAPLNTEFDESSPWVSPDERYVIAMRMADPAGLGGVDLYVSFADGAGGWTPWANLGPAVNSAANDICGLVSFDGRYLFFNSRRQGNADNYWVDAAVIEAVR
jgi:ankyrin repeat protein